MTHESEHQAPLACSGPPHSSHHCRMGVWTKGGQQHDLVCRQCAWFACVQLSLSSKAQQSVFSYKSCVCKLRLILYSNNPQEILIVCSMVTSSAWLKATVINYQTIDHQRFRKRDNKTTDYEKQLMSFLTQANYLNC